MLVKENTRLPRNLCQQTMFEVQYRKMQIVPQVTSRDTWLEENLIENITELDACKQC